MIKVRRADYDDIEDLANMYYDLIAFVYPNRKQTQKLYYYNNVLNWFKNGFDIFVSYNEEETTGFSVAYFDDFGGVVEPFYKADIAFVKEKYRLGKSAYLLYNNGIKSSNGSIIETNALVGRASKMASKFGEEIFNVYERGVS